MRPPHHGSISDCVACRSSVRGSDNIFPCFVFIFMLKQTKAGMNYIYELAISRQKLFSLKTAVGSERFAYMYMNKSYHFKLHGSVQPNSGKNGSHQHSKIPNIRGTFVGRISAWERQPETTDRCNLECKLGMGYIWIQGRCLLEAEARTLPVSESMWRLEMVSERMNAAKLWGRYKI